MLDRPPSRPDEERPSRSGTDRASRDSDDPASPADDEREGVAGRARGSLVDWIVRKGLLRGPFLFADYWASVLGLREAVPERHVERGLVDPVLSRVGLDRPDLEVPRLRHYLLLFLLGPFLLPLRRFRHLGRHYRLSYRSEIGEEIQERLREHRLELVPAGGDRVDVRAADRPLAEGVIDPFVLSGFCSLFHATYKLPLASATAILLAGVAGPLLHAAGALEPVLEYWIPAGFPALVGVLYLVYRDAVTAVLGALPVVVVRFLFPVLRPDPGEGWLAFAGALTGLFLLYLLIDWFFMPRPVPPVLMMYSAAGEGRPYDRAEDGPWWLEGEQYWVWRYLILTPAELNKFWERDWERVELWIRADGPKAGVLEWVVTDAHYRELWIPYENLGPADQLQRELEQALAVRARGETGFWLVEMDADLVFHTPFPRAVTFLSEEEGGVTAGRWHLIRSLWQQAERHAPERYREPLERAQLREGVDVFHDVPEATARLVSRKILATPWRYWRYPLGAASDRGDRLYGSTRRRERPPAADPALQVKQRESSGE